MHHSTANQIATVGGPKLIQGFLHVIYAISWKCLFMKYKSDYRISSKKRPQRLSNFETLVLIGERHLKEKSVRFKVRRGKHKILKSCHFLFPHNNK